MSIPMSTVKFSFEGKVALVTGGRTGTGRATALAFAEAGADVATCDLVVDDGQLASVTEEIKKLGRRALAVQTDATKKAQVDELVKKVVDEFGTIDILVNSVGGIFSDPGAFLQITEDTWNKYMGLNLNSVFFCSQAVSKLMIERKTGNIINFASQVAYRSRLGVSAYAIAKQGVVMLTRWAAKELAPYNVRVNCIAPSVIKTGFMDPVFHLDWNDPEIEKQATANVPLGRAADPDEIASVVLFLASDAASYMTGETVLVDGGALA